MFGFCPTQTQGGCALTMGIHLLAGAMVFALGLIYMWFLLFAALFFFLLFVIVVVFLCCPEVQASARDFVRDGKKNCLFLTPEMPVMSKICGSALRFLSLFLDPVLGSGVESVLCHPWEWFCVTLGSAAALFSLSLVFSWLFHVFLGEPGAEQHLGKAGKSRLGSKFRGFNQKCPTPGSSLPGELSSGKGKLCLLEDFLGGAGLIQKFHC